MDVNRIHRDNIIKRVSGSLPAAPAVIPPLSQQERGGKGKKGKMNKMKKRRKENKAGYTAIQSRTVGQEQ